jgi:hypothetical protein
MAGAAASADRVAVIQSAGWGCQDSIFNENVVFDLQSVVRNINLA